MLRAILPLALIALLFAPWYQSTQYDEVLKEETSVTKNGFDLLQPTWSCALDGNYSPVGDCAPHGGIKGYLLLGMVGFAAIAAVMHLIGFMSIIRKFGATLAAIAGIAGLAGAGWLGFDTFNAIGQEGIDLGLYGTGAAALITTIAGWLGMRENADY